MASPSYGTLCATRWNYRQIRRRPDGMVAKSGLEAARKTAGVHVLAESVEEFPESCEVVVVVFGDKIQMVHESHGDFQTRVGNGSRK